MRLGPAVPALLVLALAAAGCSGKGGAPTGSSGPAASTDPLVAVGCQDEAGRAVDCGTGCTADNKTAACTGAYTGPRDPVSIHETGDSLNGKGAYEFKVAPGYRRFTVDLSVTGPNGAPQYVGSGIGYTLLDGAGTTVLDNPASQTSFTSGPSGGCIVCYDGLKEPHAAGSWSFSFETGTTPGAYAVDIEVAY